MSVPKQGHLFSIIAYFWVLLAAAVGIFITGGNDQGAPGAFLAVAGLGLLFLPPAEKVDGRLWLLLSLLVLCGVTSLLPLEGIWTPSWRDALHGLPIPLANSVSPVPRQTFFFLLILGISGLLFLFLLAQPIRSATLLKLATCGVLVCLLYAILFLYTKQTGWKYPFDAGSTFGFFPNRNHAAAFLVTGCLLAVGVLGVAIRDKNWVCSTIAIAGLAVCAWLLLTYSASRGGVFFLVIGVVLWLLGLGRRHWSLPLGVSCGVLVAGALVYFFSAKGEARNRLLAQFDTVHSAAKEEGQSEDPSEQRVLSPGKLTADGRWAIYRDTWRMIQDAPVTGVGLGAFRHVFPYYRKDSLSEYTGVHPESDWLMVAVEMGLPAVAVLAAGVALLLWRLAAQRKHPFWPLRWGVACAALAAILHGVVDVPAHRITLGWWILLFLAAGLQLRREEAVRPPLWQRISYWAAGLVSLSVGVFLVRAQWFDGPAAPMFAAKKLEYRIYELYKSDKIEEAVQLSSETILKYPMAAPLYGQKGLLRLQEEGTDAEVDALFAAQRGLNPLWHQIPLEQGIAWIDIDPGRTSAAWLEAMARMKRVDANGKSGTPRSPQLLAELVQKARGRPEIQARLLEAAGSDLAMRLAWVVNADPAAAALEFPRMAGNPTMMTAFSPADRRVFSRAWYERGDRAALFGFAGKHPEWEEAVWPLRIRQMVDSKDFQRAVLTAAERYQVDLSLPAVSLGHNSPDDVESAPSVRFATFWKMGNEVTARRILDEARIKSEKSGGPAPEMWRLSASLAAHDAQWDKAWQYLGRYLRETNMDFSL